MAGGSVSRVPSDQADCQLLTVTTMAGFGPNSLLDFRPFLSLLFFCNNTNFNLESVFVVSLFDRCTRVGFSIEARGVKGILVVKKHVVK